MEPSQPPKQAQSSVATGILVAQIVGTIAGLIFHAGAAKLSYDKYGSIGWAILAFIFGSIYYPYYAFFVSGGTASTMLGGALRKMKW